MMPDSGKQDNLASPAICRGAVWHRIVPVVMLFVALLTASPLLGNGVPEADAASFLERARKPDNAATYGKLSGRIQHKKDGSAMVEYPVYLGLKLARGGYVDAQLIINDSERYHITRAAGKAAKFIAPPAGSLAAQVGLRPSDLTTGFLFYNLVREEKPERISAVPCRVFILEAPDGKEAVRIYLAKAYAFTMRAEFFRSVADVSGEPLRTLDTRSFKKQNGLYYAELLNIKGPDWQTRVHFLDSKLGMADDKEAQNVFKNSK